MTGCDSCAAICICTRVHTPFIQSPAVHRSFPPLSANLVFLLPTEMSASLSTKTTPSPDDYSDAPVPDLKAAIMAYKAHRKLEQTRYAFLYSEYGLFNENLWDAEDILENLATDASLKTDFQHQIMVGEHIEELRREPRWYHKLRYTVHQLRSLCLADVEEH